jgi:precorrin-6B methylase 2
MTTTMITMHPNITSEDTRQQASRQACQAIMNRLVHDQMLDRLHHIVHPGMRAIDMSCSAGLLTKTLSELARQEGRVMAFDWDPVNCARTRESATQAGNVTVVCKDFAGSHISEDADIVVGPSFLNSRDRNHDILQTAFRSLKPGGVIIFAFADFSSCQSFPQSFAIDSFRDHLTKYQSIVAPSTPKELVEICKMVGFGGVRMRRVLPKFLMGHARMFPAHLMEYASSFILNGHMADADELQSIIHELEYLARETPVVISEPSIYLLEAIHQ